MTLRLDTRKFKTGIILVLLFFAAMNFYAKFFYFVFAALMILIIGQRRLSINWLVLPYLAWCVLMALYNSDEGLLSMIRCVSHVSLYVVGYNMLISVPGEEKGDLRGYAEKTGFTLLVTISLGSFTHYLLNFMTNFNNAVGRNTRDIWSGAVMAATGQATLACLMLGLSVAMIYLPVRKLYRFIGIASIFCVLAYNMILAGRTIIVILCILAAVGLVYFGMVSENMTERFKLGMGITLGCLALIVAVVYDVGGIQEYIFESNLFDRFGISSLSTLTESDRTSSKWGFLVNAWRYPFGGLHLRAEYSYAHDLLLDGYDEYGVVGLLLLLWILVYGLNSLYRLLKQTDYSREIKLAFLCVYSAVLLVFTVEPILAGMPWLFAFFCMVNGVMDGMLILNRDGAAYEDITD